MYVCVYVCMYVCMYITAFASIPSNRNWGYFLFRAESHVFAGEEFESKCPMTKADLFLRIFEPIPGTLKPFETLYNVETL